MRHALRTLGLGLIASFAGVIFGATTFSVAQGTPSTLDIGEVNLLSDTMLLVPVTNPGLVGAMNVGDLSTSCGCATVPAETMQVPARSARMLAITVRPKPPQSDVSFALRMTLDGKPTQGMMVSGRVRSPFEGYPLSAVGVWTGRGLVVSTAVVGDSFIVRAEAFQGETQVPMVCLWSPESHEIVIPARPGAGRVDLVVWSSSDATPAWSGPVTVSEGLSPSSKEKSP